jgi:hypothetical protein
MLLQASASLYSKCVCHNLKERSCITNEEFIVVGSSHGGDWRIHLCYVVWWKFTKVSATNTEVLGFFETLVSIWQAMQSRIPQDNQTERTEKILTSPRVSRIIALGYLCAARGLHVVTFVAGRPEWLNAVCRRKKAEFSVWDE